MSDEEDPLGLKELALNYDYSIYKINDYINNLSEMTFESVSKKDKLIKQEYFHEQLNLAEELDLVDKLVQKCNDIELEFMKIDQLQMFINDFKLRLSAVEQGFSEEN